MAEAYDRLSEFERDLRNFVHQRMSEAFGSDWEKRRVPPEMYKSWREKREKAKLAGEPQGLLLTTQTLEITSQSSLRETTGPTF